MVIWNGLEDLRRRENAKRGYSEVKTPLLYDVDTYITSGHYENYAENMFLRPGPRGREAARAEADELPRAHAALRQPAAQLPRAPDPLRGVVHLHRDEKGGTLHGLLRVKHITQDDAHVFVTEEQIQGEIDGMIDFTKYLYDLFGLEFRAELSTRPRNGSAPTRSGTTRRERSRTP